ncbi:hypothetical protein [Chitinibacter sp. ZOR0017]|uniref:hypothetical protein n=1 Tax=Chitinibacter sp. ZOR0017 TaxID=1339254 RepID=UPI00064555B4|nr:hypothetical protein [Chitinibacter sp. ZOR0017]
MSTTIDDFSVFRFGTEGIGAWITSTTPDEIISAINESHLKNIDRHFLNQLLALGHEAPVSEGFFKYYWCEMPKNHPYAIEKLKCEKFDFSSIELTIGNSCDSIKSKEHLAFGLCRLYTDGLMWWGNIRSAYRELRGLSYTQIASKFEEKMINHKPSESHLNIERIPKDDRHLISEIACKTIANEEEFREKFRKLLEERKTKKGPQNAELDFFFGENEDDIEQVIKKFSDSRSKAIKNTKFYLSMANALDCYVATSMRTRADFRNTATQCELIFENYENIKKLNLKYFDPTLSAANGHEDKGLIECLMVKCAKVLIYFSGEKDSFGKDAEAAMALSLGKPVLFICSNEEREKIHRDVHPLSRLIQFSTGTPVGAIICNATEAPSIIERLFTNKMEYKLTNNKNHIKIIEQKTSSVVRLQTHDRMLFESFWNHYHNKT